MSRRKLLLGIAWLAVLGLVILGGLGWHSAQSRETHTFLLPVALPASESSILDALHRLFRAGWDYWEIDANSVLPSEIEPPEIQAEAALLVDIPSDTVLYAKNSHQRRPVASTIKIMTAVVALERGQLGQKIRISEKAVAIGEDTMGVSAGEIYTLEELLYGLMLPSGNDAAEAIAEGLTKGNRERFIDWMNDKAWELGLEETRFANPSGLDGDGQHYSSAYDLLVLARYAWWHFPKFREIVATREYEIPHSPEHKYLYLPNQTNLLGTYPGVVGIKPGWTPEAGLCLVTAAVRGDYTLIGVILGSNDRRGEMELLLDYGFGVLGP